MEALDEWGADFVAFHSRFAGVFRRKEPRAQAMKYLRGLMAQIERKNSWQVAEAVGDRIPDVPCALGSGRSTRCPAAVHHRGLW